MSDPQKHSSVLDIAAEQLGKPYARALIGAAHREGAAEEVLNQLSEIVDEGVSKHPALASALMSPRISQVEKDRVIDKLFAPQVHSVLVRAMKVMNAHGRLGYLPAVRDAAAAIIDEQMGRVVAEVRTAVPLDEELRGDVRQHISSSLGKDVRLKEVVDESLIGGMVIRVGDTVFDSSVSGRLAKLSQSVKAGFAQKLLAHAESFVSDGSVDQEATPGS